jgi:hypothetical protein
LIEGMGSKPATARRFQSCRLASPSGNSISRIASI